VDSLEGVQNEGSEWRYVASPAWLNVQRSDLGPSDHVRAVWIDNSQFVGQTYSQNQVDLSYAGNGRFTAQLPDTVEYLGDESGGLPTSQQLAIVVDGDWLTDPVSGSHNFNLQLSSAPRDG
jgi:hypothetical protein